MKRLLLLAAALMISSTAHAGHSYTFTYEGQRVHVEAPRNCRSLSCVSISGLKSKSKKADETTARTDPPAATGAPTTPATPATVPAGVGFDPRPAAATPAPKSETITAMPAPATPAPAPAATTTATTPASAATTTAATPAPAAAATATKPAPAATTAATTPAPTATTTAITAAPTATTTATTAAPTATTVAAAPVSPLGLWATEQGKGKVRIEECAKYLCGYAVANNEKVLIDMKPSGSKWVGRIYNPDGNRTYNSTIALKGPNTLRVQGCIYGVLCGGETWTRIS
jgi:uncharacterized protein (DUF2147 family)